MKFIEFDASIPGKDPGWWGLKVNGSDVSEVIWCHQKPTLGLFTSVRPKALEDDPFPGIESLEVVKVSIVPTSEPQLLAKSWYRDE